jgi:2-amino-4-hydroxy-6-hydroxymethyldihydropteridine diphosphokinase
MTVRVWLSLGSNIDREKNIRSAMAALEKAFGELVVSPIYESEAVGFDGDPFLNLVVGLDTDLPPTGIAATLRRIEQEHGRSRGAEKFVARTLDIDLLTYGQQVIRAPGVDVPRDEITRYAFVLRPLSQVAGNELHPVEGVSYQALWDAFDKSQQQLRAVDLGLNRDCEHIPRGLPRD